MYRDDKVNLDERDRAVGAILIGEALIASCERAQASGDAHGPAACRAIRDAHDHFPELRRSELVVGALVLLFTCAVLTWLSAIVPSKKPDRNAAMRRELADIALQRRFQIIELQHSLGDRCDPAQAHQLAKQLVMDGRGSD